MSIVPVHEDGGPLQKKARLDIIVSASAKDGIVSIPQSDRKSGLLAPTMALTGHEAEVYCVEFSPDGRNIASGSFDKTIQVYGVYGDCENWCQLRGHQNAVLELHWSPDGSRIYSASADKTCAAWDPEAGQRVKKLAGHTAVVNSVQAARRGPPLVVSGADDGTTKVWDLRQRRCAKTFEHAYQVLAVSFDDPAERVFAASLDHTIRVYSMRKEGEEEMVLQGHADSVTSLDLSKDGTRLVSNAMDNTVRIWDVQPFVPHGQDRCTATLFGAVHNYEKLLLRARWSPGDRLIAAGSADRFLNVWSVADGRLLYKLPGHAGSVNDAAFHPTEPVVASAGSDKKVFMGELGD